MLDSVRQLEIKCREWNSPKPPDTYNGYYIPRRIPSGDPPYLADTISPKSYARAFHLMDALLRALLPYEGLMQLGFNHSLRVNGEDV